MMDIKTVAIIAVILFVLTRMLSKREEKPVEQKGEGVQTKKEEAIRIWRGIGYSFLAFGLLLLFLLTTGDEPIPVHILLLIGVTLIIFISFGVIGIKIEYFAEKFGWTLGGEEPPPAPVKSSSPGVVKTIADAVQTEPPGPAELGRDELQPGEARRYCTRWSRTVALIPHEPEFLSCEWTLAGEEGKKLCYQACVHNVVNQLVISTVVKQMELSPVQAIALMKQMGIEDHAPT